MRSLTSIRPWYLGIVTPPLAVATTLAALLTLSPPASATPTPDGPAATASPEPTSDADANANANADPNANVSADADASASASANANANVSADAHADAHADANASANVSASDNAEAAITVAPEVAAPDVAAPDAVTPDVAAPDAVVAPADTVDSPAVLARAVHFKGAAFDTCEAPPLATMKAWKSSSYRGVGVYFAGRGRGCPDQQHLSRSWLASVDEMGWRVLPIFVGSQSPCVRSEAKRKVRMGSKSATQGRTEGRQAAEAAEKLGIQQGSALYLDMEAYDANNAGCARTTLAFVRAWNREVRGRGFLPGFYSSAASGVWHMEQARRAGQADLPSVMWFARWGSGPTLYGEPTLHADAWRPHRRIHQYAGNVAETHGGRRLVVDRNTVDAPVARFEP
ncbi:DUF1906 domain-containing protein [Streptomyces sp. NPDC023838]|uniref:DUF1906 domain-containing protein n=1 Tax=Streptomyces sp. NPDC023838 TaxID=3154325 RepID=UPI0034064A28